MIEATVEFLMKHQNSDGGWGSAPRRVSNTESTSLAVLALDSTNKSSLEKQIRLGNQWLTEGQRVDGSWPLNRELKEASWATSLAVIALGSFPEHQERALKGVGWIISQEGNGLPLLASLLVRLSIKKLETSLDPDLKGWSWTSGSFSWVEPTAYALIALKKIKFRVQDPRALHRIQQGEKMIYDRMCEGGGWNYGTPDVFGEKAWPYPDTTALSLIATQDHGGAPANRLSLKALERMLTQEMSALSLAWSILCFSVYGADVSGLRNALATKFEQTRSLGETRSMALALLALGAGSRYFRV